MARFLALELEPGRAHLLVAATAGGRATAERVAAWAEDAPLTVQSAAEVGARLKARLAELGVAPAPLVVAIGRDRLLLKDVRHPTVPAHETPALVRFQVVKDLSESPDEQVIDYVPTLTGVGESRALALVMRKEIQRAVVILAEAAGLKLAGTTPRLFGVAVAYEEAVRGGALVPPERPGTAVAILARGERGGEFVVVRDGAVQLARAIGGPTLTNEAALLGEVKRNLAVYNSQAPGSPVGLLAVAEAAGRPGGFAGRLAGGLGVPVQTFDPVADVPGADDGAARGTQAGLFGLLTLLGRADGLPVNFASPREPKPPRDPSARLFALAGVVAAAVALLATAWSFSARAALDTETEALQAQKAALDLQLVALEQSAKRVKAVDDWQARGVVWLDELYELAANFPDVDRARVTQFLGEPTAVVKGGDGKYVARMSVRMVTEDGKYAESLVSAMVRDDHYKVAPKEPRGNTAARGSRFTQQFGIRAEVTGRPPDAYAGVLTAKRPPRRTEDDGGAGAGGFGGMFNPFGGR